MSSSQRSNDNHFKKDTFSRKRKRKDDSNDNLEETNRLKKKCYPNCDVSVWLRSCEQEILEPLNGVVTGIIPKWLKGSLLRNGPGSLKVGDQHFEHLFDASALLHRFCIDDGRITYQCRFVETEVLKRNSKANRIVVTEFGTCSVPDPCQTIFQRIAAVFNPKSDNFSDNSMISIYPIGDEMFAFGENSSIHRINKINLKTEERIDISRYVSILHHTSHPHVMDDGTVYNLALSRYPSGLYHTIVKFPPASKGDWKSMLEQGFIVASLPVRWPFYPSYMHTFGITENYFIIVEQPLSVSVTGLALAKLKSEPLIGSFKWYQNEQTQINVVSRHSGKLVYKFYSKAFFYLHIINQYETSDSIILDICTYRDPSMLECMYVSNMETIQQNTNYAEMFRSKPLRFVLPLQQEASWVKTKVEIEPELLSNLGCETPRINYELYLGKTYRYFYAISADVDSYNPGTIIKVDTFTKCSKTWNEKNCYPSEPVFVPRPFCKFEDDGVILAALVWGGDDQNHSGLLILDAQTMKEIGRSEFRTPGPVPKCLHGWFLPQRV